MPTATRKRILVSIPTEQHAERMKLEGVLRYAHEKAGERWDVMLDLGDKAKRSPDGLIAYVTSDAQRRKILSANVPTVLIEDRLEPASFPRRRNVVTLLCDHVAEGATAARHFLARHYERFFFIGAATDWSRRRYLGFRRTVEQAGFRCRLATVDDIGRLPHPSAIFAAHDILGRRVLAAAEERGVAIPDDLAVLGVDDDEVMCTTSAPTLSSIPTFDRSLGYAAGRALNGLLSGHSGGCVIRTRHTKVVTRASTQKDAVGDPFVARMLDFARTHLAAKLDAASLARSIGYSKQQLQMRTKRALGLTLGETVRSIRLEAAKDLLARTDDSVAAIAERCGYASVSHLALRFRDAVNMTPLAYRRQSRTLAELHQNRMTQFVLAGRSSERKSPVSRL